MSNPPDAIPVTPDRARNNPGPLTEQDAAAILAGASPSRPDHFAILSRRGRRLSEEEVVAILMEGADGGPPAGPRDLPMAQRSPVPAVPPVPLGYIGRRHDRRPPTRPAVRADRWSPGTLPLRALSVGLWLAVAGLVLFILLSIILARFRL